MLLRIVSVVRREGLAPSVFLVWEVYNLLRSLLLDRRMKWWTSGELHPADILIASEMATLSSPEAHKKHAPSVLPRAG